MVGLARWHVSNSRSKCLYPLLILIVVNDPPLFPRMRALC